MTRKADSLLWAMVAAVRAWGTRLQRRRGPAMTLPRAAQVRQSLDSLLKAGPPAPSLESMCQMLVASGAATLGCVYSLERDVVRRIACAGPAQALLRDVPVVMPLSDPDVNHSYTAGVLRSGVAAVSNDYVLDSRAGRWREMAVASGVRSILWAPIHGLQSPAVLMLCSGQPDFFDGELVQQVQAVCDRLARTLVAKQPDEGA